MAVKNECTNQHLSENVILQQNKNNQTKFMQNLSNPIAQNISLSWGNRCKGEMKWNRMVRGWKHWSLDRVCAEEIFVSNGNGSSLTRFDQLAQI